MSPGGKNSKRRQNKTVYDGVYLITATKAGKPLTEIQMYNKSVCEPNIKGTFVLEQVRSYYSMGSVFNNTELKYTIPEQVILVPARVHSDSRSIM